MRFLKEELSFLKLYSMLSDNRSFLNDKICIESVSKTKTVTFSQLSHKFNLITKINKEIKDDEDFSLIINVNIFYQLISSLPNNTYVNITKDGIFFNSSKYDLQKYEGDYSVVSKFEEAISLKETAIFSINEIDKMVLLKNYCGKDELDTIALIEGNFVASNRTDITGVIKTNNDKNLIFYFPSDFVSIINLQNLKSIDIKTVEYNDKNITYFILNNIIVIINEFTYALKNIFVEEIKRLYDHNTKILVDKNSFLEVLSRIAIVSKDNIYNRIFISFDNTNIIIESKDVGYSVEKIPYISIDPSLVGIKIILSVNNLKTIIQSLTGKQVYIKASADEDAVAVSFEDENKDRFYIHTLYENIDE